MARAEVAAATTYSNSGGATTIAVTRTSITAGSLVVVGCRYEGATPTISSFTDSAGATYTVISGSPLGSNPSVVLAYKFNHPGGSNVVITLTLSTSVSYRDMCVVELAGQSDSTDPLDVSGTAQNAGTVTELPVTMTATGAGTALHINGWYGGTTPAAISPATEIGSDYSSYSTMVKRDVSGAGSVTISSGPTSGNSNAIAAVFLDNTTVYTYTRPTSDITTQWTPSSGSDHFALIDEPLESLSDADYIYATAAAQTDEIQFGTLQTPVAATNIEVNYRVQGIASGATVTLSVYEGATLRKTDTTRTANGDYTCTITPSDYASVTFPWALRGRFVSG